MPRPASDSYLLLTGATGLLGRCLVRDLAATGRRLAVVVRAGRDGNAAERVDDLLADWHDVAGAEVDCPVVLQGDLASPSLGLDAAARGWVARNVGELIHSAASLSFHTRQSDGEPWRSNVEGSRQVVALCRETGIRRIHHVSSAYVCGLRTGTILETELDVGQTSGNDYERSKIVSETEVREADCFDCVTVHRPSIIVGDLVNGFTNTFHGFYKPLRIVQPFVEAFASADLPAGSLMEVLGMTGAERKNLVSVDWVSAAMTRIVNEAACHGRTYHLTNEDPTPVGTLSRVFEGLVVEMTEAIRRQQAERPTARGGFDPATLGRLFLDQMHVYRAYWRDDPRFDTRHTRQVLPDLPAPALDDASLRRLCRFAITAGFRWPITPRTARPPVARDLLVDLLGPAAFGSAPRTSFGLAVAGSGGGQWTVGVVDGIPRTLHVGLPAVDRPTIRVSAAVLLSALTSPSSDRPVTASVEGPHADRGPALGLFHQLVARGQTRSSAATTAAPLDADRTTAAWAAADAR